MLNERKWVSATNKTDLAITTNLRNGDVASLIAYSGTGDLYLQAWEKYSNFLLYKHYIDIFFFQDIEVGKPVRPQLAMRIGNSAAAWKKVSNAYLFLD